MALILTYQNWLSQYDFCKNINIMFYETPRRTTPYKHQIFNTSQSTVTNTNRKYILITSNDPILESFTPSNLFVRNQNSSVCNRPGRIPSARVSSQQDFSPTSRCKSSPKRQHYLSLVSRLPVNKQKSYSMSKW